MAINISITGSKISGKGKVLNGLKVENTKKGNVNIEVENSKIQDRAKVLNDLNVGKAKVNVKVEGLNLGKEAEFMNEKGCTDHENFETKLSMGGKLKNIDTKVSRSTKDDDEELKRKPKSTDKER